MGPTPAALVLLVVLAALPPTGTAAAAASANAISCYTSVPRAPGQRPAVTPVAYPRTDGYSACLRYQYRCTADSATCLASEIGSWKYHYYGSSVQQCRSIISKTARMALRSVFCCTADKCNAPDPRRDPATQLLSESWLSRSRPTAQRTRTSPLSSAAGAFAAAPSGEARAGSVASEGSAAAVPAAVPMAAAAPAAPLAAAGRIATAPATAQQQACWYSIPCAPGLVREAALLGVEAGAQFCARWQIRCTLPSTTCSQSDVAARAWRWVYGSVDGAGCAALESGGAGGSSKGVRNALCCSGRGCNKPDSQVDTLTRTHTEAAAESAATPQLQQQQQQQPAVLQPVAKFGVAAQQPILIAAIGFAGHPSSGGVSGRSSRRRRSGGGASWGVSSTGSRSSSGRTTAAGSLAGR